MPAKDTSFAIVLVAAAIVVDQFKRTVKVTLWCAEIQHRVEPERAAIVVLR